jgi:outer membrane usher protein
LYEAEVSRAGGETGVRLGASGTIGVMDGGAFVARRLDQSFAQVRVDGVEGVRVYANNQLVGTTNKAGMVLVPRLQPYEPNAIRIDPADVPIEFELSDMERLVTPAARSGVVVRFGARRVTGGLVRIALENGSALPAGAALKRIGSADEFVVAPGGEAFLTGLEPANLFEASWNGGRCLFQLPYRQGQDAQPLLGTFTCRPFMDTIAARQSITASPR